MIGRLEKKQKLKKQAANSANQHARFIQFQKEINFQKEILNMLEPSFS